MRCGALISLAVFGSYAFAGCNIFQFDAHDPAAEVARLQERFAAFVLPVSKATMTAADVFEVAKRTRQSLDLGPLSVARLFLYTPGVARRIEFPFSDRTPLERDELQSHVLVIDQAATVIVMANEEGIARRPGQFIPSDDALRLAARRVIVTDEIDPCTLYPDFLVARLLRVTLDFHRDLDAAAGLRVDGTSTGYAPVWVTPTLVTRADAEAYNEALVALRDVLDADIRPYLDSFDAFGCLVNNTEIIDPQSIAAWMVDVLLRSFDAYAVNTGVAGSPGVGDNDGDGVADEETINGQDDDGDGLTDEDARL